VITRAVHFALLALVIASLVPREALRGQTQSTCGGETAPGWFRSSQRALIPADRSVRQVEQDLIARARQQVVEQASGVQVSVATMRTRGETMTDGRSASYSDVYMEMFRQASDGRIIEERRPVCVTLLGTDSLVVVLDARVEVEREAAATGFEGSVRTNQPVYRVGDAVEISVEASEQTRVYLFAVDATGVATLVFPNRYDTLNVLQSRQARRVPARGAPYSLVAELNPELGAPHGEMVLAVFYRGAAGSPFATADAFARRFTLAEINRTILALPRRDRIEMMADYEIRSADVPR